jgi:hypothetical protein
MKNISQLVKSVWIQLVQERWAAYEIHGGYLTGRGEMGQSSVGVRQFGDDFSPVIHGKQENLVELAFGYFHDFHARFRANGTGSKSIELWHVEFHVAVRKLCPLPPEPSP